MTANELIAELRDIIDEYGDLDVLVHGKDAWAIPTVKLDSDDEEFFIFLLESKK